MLTTAHSRCTSVSFVLVFEDYDLIVIQRRQDYRDATVISLGERQFLIGAQETDGSHGLLGFEIDADAGNGNRHVHRVAALADVVVEAYPFEFAVPTGALVDLDQGRRRDDRAALEPQDVVNGAEQQSGVPLMGPPDVVRADAEGEAGDRAFAVLAADQGRMVRHVAIVAFLGRAEHVCRNQPQHLRDVIIRLIHLELTP